MKYTAACVFENDSINDYVCLFLSVLVGVQTVPSLKFNTPTRPQFTINQNFQGGQIITDNIECTSSEIDDVIVYSFLDSESNERFHVNSSSAVLSMAIDAIELSCIDCNFQPTLVCTAGSTINATRINIFHELYNAFTPMFIDSFLSKEVQENTNFTARPPLITVNATDEDRGDCGVITFSIVSGNRDGRFQIDSSTGSLVVVSLLDYEETISYTLRLRVTNTLCSPNLGSEINARIDIVNINDESPVFNPRMYSAIVNEFDSHPNNRIDVVKQLRCSDLDTDSTSLRYEKMFSNEPFDVNFNTGAVFIPAEHALDYEEQTFYELQFKCFDLSAPDMFDIATLSVQIIPIDEHAPEVGTSQFRAINNLLPVGTLIASNLPNTDALISIGAVDRDEGSNHGDILFAFKRADIAEYFSLDPSSGNITLIKSLTYRYCVEPMSGSELIFIPLAVCSANNPSIQTCPSFDISLFVTVTGNNCTPSFNQNNFDISVNESVSIGTVLYNFVCNTPGSIDDANERLELRGQVNVTAYFDIVDGGALLLRNTLDFESETDYDFNLYCLDLISNQTAEASVHIEVLPSNDFAPMFTRSFYTYAPKTLVNIGQVEAIDGDAGSGSDLTYKLISGDSDFLLVHSSGQVSFVDNVDFSTTTCDKLVAIIQVTDGLYTDQAMILVNLTFVFGTSVYTGTSITPSQGCNGFCVAFAVALIVLIVSLFMHLFTCVLLALCYRKHKRDSVIKIQNSILEKAGSIRRGNNTDSSHNYR